MLTALIGAFGSIAIVCGGTAYLVSEPTVEIQNMICWGLFVPLCAWGWVSVIGRPRTDRRKLIGPLCGFACYLYALLLFFWIGGWPLFTADTFLIKAIALISVVASFFYIRVIHNTSKLALSLNEKIENLSSRYEN